MRTTTRILVSLVVLGSTALGSSSIPLSQSEGASSPWSFAAAPWAELSAGLARESTARPLTPWPAWTQASDPASDPWCEAAPWRRWSELISGVADAEVPDPRLRAALAWLAHLQGRDEDAWSWLAPLGSEPGRSDAGTLRALLPRLFPGVPPDLDADGLVTPLPDGVLLFPALPPDEDPPLQRAPTIGVRGLRVAEAELELELTWERDGTQLKLRHLGGGPARVRVVLPRPRGVDFGTSYVDWERTEARILEVVATAEEPEHTFWGRYVTTAAGLPGAARELSARVRLGGIVVAADAGDCRARRFASALGELLEVSTRLVHATPSTGPLTGNRTREAGPFEALFLDLRAGPATSARKLEGLIGLTERFSRAGPP